jgi:dTDP-4-amino-4,6-dideoxygalactose transaminase
MTVTSDPALAKRMRLFSDKGWPREGELRTHLFYGLNYRMTELHGAVALAQLAKLDGVIEDRRRWGHLLEELLADVPGISFPQLPEGRESVYWLFPVSVDPEKLGATVGQMTAAIAAEGIPVAPGYVMPLYLTPALAEGKTYGDSHFPFDSPYTTRSYTEYRPGLCPVAEAMGDRMFTVAINERYTEQDVRDIAEAITKVATVFAANS